MDLKHEAIKELGARHPDVARLTRASRLVAARLNGNPHRGMIPGDECPHCYEVNVSVDDDPDPIWYDQCLSHRAEWRDRQSAYMLRLIDAIERATSTHHMSDAPRLRRSLAKAAREWREVTGERFILKPCEVSGGAA